jgi:HSP20 family molecular chaperone IbpA
MVVMPSPTSWATCCSVAISRREERLSRELFSYPTGGGTGWMPMDAWRRGDVVEVPSTGIDPGSVDLTVEQDILTVKAERRWQPQEDLQLFLCERACPGRWPGR